MDFSKWIFLDRVSGDRYTCVYSMQKGAPPSFCIVSFLIPSPEDFAVFVPPGRRSPSGGRRLRDLLERLEDVPGDLHRILVRDGLLVIAGHAGAGVPHQLYDILRLQDVIGLEVLAAQGFLGIDDVPPLPMARRTMLIKQLFSRLPLLGLGRKTGKRQAGCT